MTDLKDWMTVFAQFLNTFAILYGILRVVTRIEKENDDKSNRLIAAERAISTLQQAQSSFSAILTKVDDLGKEMERIRDRLDKFLDRQTS